MGLAPQVTRRTLQTLADADAWLSREVGELASVAPDRPTATSLEELGQWVVDAEFEEAERLGRRLAELVQAQHESFPENIFWDLDRLVASVVLDALQSSERTASYVDDIFDELIALHCLYGRDTEIRFRYVHDFQYGFDWAKWVQKDPNTRQRVAPFSLPFLRAIRSRGRELLELIARDDAAYPRLRSDRPRNPFPFSREPDDEARLYRDLARRSLIPIEAWRVDGRVEWRPPFVSLREARARELGLLDKKQ